MFKLNWIKVDGFKSFKSLKQVDLRHINVIIGPNGSGKSNFIELFSFLEEIRNGNLEEYTERVGTADDLLYNGVNNTKHIRVRIAFEDPKVNPESDQYFIKLEANADLKLIPVDERTYFWNKARVAERPFREFVSPASATEAGISAPRRLNPQNRVMPHVKDALQSWRAYHFHDTSPDSLLRTPTRVDDNHALDSSGSNLAAMLFHYCQAHPNAYEAIRNTVQLAAPFLDDFVLAPMESNLDMIQLRWRQFHSDKEFGAKALSDGTLRFIALATLFMQPEEYMPSTIVIDEPELGLHPYAIRQLASMIKSVPPEKQVVAATQSPRLLDLLSPDDVLIAEREAGETRITPLTSDRIIGLLGDHSLGDLWEMNELGGRPKRE